MAQVIYLGPDYLGLRRFVVYNSIPSGLQPVVDDFADVQLLLVPLASSAVVQAEISQPGTPENAAYIRLSTAALKPSQPQAPNSNVGSIYDKPNPSKMYKSDGNTVVNPADGINPDGSLNTRVAAPLPAGANKIGSVDAVLTGSNLQEQKTQANATGGVVTFSKPISTLEIYNTDATNAGVFTVNGIAMSVPKNTTFKSGFGGTPSPTVSVTGATTYILNRYE